jgi:WD40 repeat protein
MPGLGRETGHDWLVTGSLTSRRMRAEYWTRVTEGEYWDDEPRWSPDGRILYFSSNRTGFPNVWGIHFNSPIGKRVGEPFRVTTFEGPVHMRYPGYVAFAIGAHRLMVNLVESSGNIWVLENVDR